MKQPKSVIQHVITAVSADALRIGWTSFGLMRKHVSTTRLTYLAAVLQDASKSYVAFFCYYALQCEMRIQRPQAYAHSCTFMFMITDNTHSIWRSFFFETLQINHSSVTV